MAGRKTPLEICVKETAMRLSEFIRQQCRVSSRQWWNETVETVSRPFSRMDFDRAFSRTPRMIGGSVLQMPRDIPWGSSTEVLNLFYNRPAHGLARGILLLLAMSQVPSESRGETIFDIFVKGDNAEREALLRTLPLLPDGPQYLTTAVEACRTNVQTVFEAIACENPYPCRYFPELNFNQLVMKALFIGLPLRRIADLSAHITPTLRHMVQDYIEERIAAGRPVQEDTAMILLPNEVR